VRWGGFKPRVHFKPSRLASHDDKWRDSDTDEYPGEALRISRRRNGLRVAELARG
jgi:hypothetical protein